MQNFDFENLSNAPSKIRQRQRRQSSIHICCIICRSFIVQMFECIWVSSIDRIKRYRIWFWCFSTVPYSFVVYYIVFHYKSGLRFSMLYTQLMYACMCLTTRYENQIETKYNDKNLTCTSYIRWHSVIEPMSVNWATKRARRKRNERKQKPHR